MKILHTVESYDPAIGGMQEVVKQLSEALVKQGHQVTVATSSDPARKSHSINGVIIQEFAISGNYVNGMKGDTKAYQDFLLHSDFDIITNFAAQQWATDLMLPLLREIKTKKVFVPTGFSALYIPKYSAYFEMIKEWMNQYDVNVFLSDTYQDIEFARKNGVRECRIIPNGASAEEFLSITKNDIRKNLGIPVNHFLILHVGSHTGVKGHKEAIRIFTKAKIKNTTLLIIGNQLKGGCFYACKRSEKIHHWDPFFKISDKKLIIAPLSREETVAAYNEADLFLFPSNIECSPIVLFECMASKTPFLSTDVGNAKEIIEWSHAGEILPTKKDNRGFSHADTSQSAKLLEDLYRDPERRATMKESGFKAWEEQFSWEKIAKKYESLYLELLQ